VAQPGPKRKPVKLHLVEGTLRKSRHGDQAEVAELVEQAAEVFGPLKRPAELKGVAKDAWDKWVAKASWQQGGRGDCLLPAVGGI
jgi:hypothetical protein